MRLDSPSRSNRSHRLGFTLIELLLVLVILAVLAAVVVPNLMGRGEEAKRRATITSIHNIKEALKAYEIDNGNVPDTNSGLAALITPPQGAGSNWHRLLEKIPTDGWGQEFTYQAPSTISPGDPFDIISVGKDGQLGTEDDINQLTEK